MQGRVVPARWEHAWRLADGANSRSAQRPGQPSPTTCAVLLRPPHIQERQRGQARQQRGALRGRAAVDQAAAIEAGVGHSCDVGVAPAGQERQKKTLGRLGRLVSCAQHASTAPQPAIPLPHLYCLRSRKGGSSSAASRTNSGRSRECRWPGGPPPAAGPDAMCAGEATTGGSCIGSPAATRYLRSRQAAHY